jgi:hypothetical protein
VCANPGPQLGRSIGHQSYKSSPDGVHEPFKVAIVRCVVQAGCSAENVNGVTVTPKEAVWSVAKELLTTMGLDLRKGHLQAPPRPAINGVLWT